MNYSTAHLGLSRDMFLNIGLLVGAISCFSIPAFAWLADSFGRRRIYVTGALIGAASAVPFFIALENHNTVLILLFAILLANVAHDMIVSVQQPMFTELFGTAYRLPLTAIAVQAWVIRSRALWAAVYRRAAGDIFIRRLVRRCGLSGDRVPDLRRGRYEYEATVNGLIANKDRNAIVLYVTVSPAILR